MAEPGIFHEAECYTPAGPQPEALSFQQGRNRNMETHVGLGPRDLKLFS